MHILIIAVLVVVILQFAIFIHATDKAATRMNEIEAISSQGLTTDAITSNELGIIHKAIKGTADAVEAINAQQRKNSKAIKELRAANDEMLEQQELRDTTYQEPEFPTRFGGRPDNDPERIR